MRTRTTPERTCVGCNESGGKRALVRIVRTGDGDAVVDPTGKMNGRGAYIHPEQACFESAVRRKRIGSALRVTLDDEDIDRLRQEFERLLPPRPADAEPGTVNLNA
jgi:predicted RNA-binding protein YlxR (DUF448 family)